jgi:hypothetical protein
VHALTADNIQFTVQNKGKGIVSVLRVQLVPVLEGPCLTMAADEQKELLKLEQVGGLSTFT